MPNTRFQDLTNAVDDLVDTHVGDELTLYRLGVKYLMRGTINVRQIEQVSDGGILSIVNQVYVSVASRLMPSGMLGEARSVKLVRRDPYETGEDETFTVVSISRPRSGRSLLILERAKNAVSSVEPRTTDAARQNADPAPHR